MMIEEADMSNWQWFSLEFISSSQTMLTIKLTLFPVGGHICPPYHILAIFSGSTYPRRLQVYSKFKFCNCRTYKIGPGSKKFSYGAGEPAEVGWVVDFLLRFRLKIDCIFTFHEMRWIFLAEIELSWPQVLKQKIKTCSEFSFAKRIRGLAPKLAELEPF